MKHTVLIWMLILSAALVMSGCSRAIGEAYEGFAGPKGVHREIRSLGPAGARPLAEYKNFEVGTFVDDFGGQIPPELLRNVGPYTIEELREKGLPTGRSGKTLVIQGRVFYYEDASVSGHIFGPFEEALATIRLVDKSSKAVVAEAVCIGRTTKSVRKGIDNKTRGMANAIADWIDGRYPRDVGRVPKPE